MLVLSRRPHETIVFPNLDITVRVLRVQGNAVRLGVEAPREVRVLRQELAGPPGGADTRPRHGSLAHALCNRLNKVSLSLHLAQRQLQAGRLEEAEGMLGDALAKLDEIDHEWVAAR